MDERLNYQFVKRPDEEPIPNGCCIIAPNEEDIELDKVDYYVPLPQGETKHKQPLPLSFLQIRQGDVQSGIEWYKNHYPKVPDDLIEIMARYNFGDLKYATRKSIRNNVKKYKKKNSDPKGLQVKKGPFKVTFD